MIPRSLIPLDARPPVSDSASQRRRPTSLDERTLVPAMLPIVPLDGRTNIPSNLPLDSISARVVVPRDINPEAYGVKEDFSVPLQPTELNERIAVPQGAAAPEISANEFVPQVSTDLVDPDVFMTGEVHLVAAAPSPEKTRGERVTRFSSIGLHILLILAIIFQPKLFPPHQRSAEEEEILRNQISVLLPPGALEALKPSNRPPQPHSTMRVDPKTLRRVAPPIEHPAPAPAPIPQPTQPTPRELPSAPVPQPNPVQPPQTQPAASLPKSDIPKPALKLETPDSPQPQQGLILPKNSVSRAIQDSIRDAGKNASAGGRAGAVSGPMPHSPGSDSPTGGGGQGAGSFGNGYEILTPTEGVDFSDYMKRVVASVRRNWYAVMPESAQLGDRGRVALQFRIMRDGSVPSGEPQRLLGSGKEPLDRAAISAIRSSNPFEPLPQAFSGPYIELRFYFLYNLPIEDAYK